MTDDIRLASIIIPCHNDSERLPIALAGIANQKTRLRIECLVIDDASDQNIRSICDQYGAQYFRGEWHNASAARNFGLRQAQGQIIYFFDADNALEPDYVEQLAQPILTNEADVVYSARGLIGETQQLRFDYFNCRTVRLEDLKMGAQIDTASAIRRSCLSDDPWDASLNRGQDWDFHLRLMQTGARYHYLPQKLWRYWITPSDSPKQTGRDRHYLTSHAAVRRHNNLAQAGMAPITIGLHFPADRAEIDRQLQAALNERRRFESANLHLIFDHPTEELFRSHLLPWVIEHEIDFAGILVTFDLPEPTEPCQRLMRSLELHLQHTTTSQLLLIGFEDCPHSWMRDHTPVPVANLRRLHWFSPIGQTQIANPDLVLPDLNAPQTVIVVHDVVEPKDLDGLFDQTDDYRDTTRFVIFAHDQASHQRLWQSNLPTGCWLPAWSANRARILNQILTEEIDMVILTAAAVWPRPWLIPITWSELASNTALTGQTTWPDYQIDQLQYICAAKKFTTELSSQSGVRLLNPWPSALNPRRISGPLFEPRLSDDWASLMIDASFRLKRKSIDVLPGRELWAHYPRSINTYQAVDELKIVECLSLNAPWRYVLAWCQRGQWPGPAAHRGRLNHYRVWLADVWRRWREPEKRHLWRPL